MTRTEGKTASTAVKDILLSNPDGLREVIRAVMQEALEAEIDEAPGASNRERTPERLGYRSGTTVARWWHSDIPAAAP